MDAFCTLKLAIKTGACLAFTYGDFMEQLSGNPRVELFDSQHQVPVPLQESKRESALALAADGTRVRLGYILPRHGAKSNSGRGTNHQFTGLSCRSI